MTAARLPKQSIIGLIVLVMALIPGGRAQDTGAPPIAWEAGATTGKIGNIAEIVVPEGYLFTGKAGAQKLLELTHNIPGGDELAALVPQGEGEQDQWFVIFEFSETGYIKDDEKDDLDADAILESIQEGTEEQNEARQSRGWPAFHVVGWERSPFYDPRTNNLTWSIRGRSDAGGDSINYSTRLLGRRGTMNVDLVVDPTQAPQAIPRLEALLAEFSYIQGQRYADYITGDKVASYGLTALVAGGAGALAVKTGLLQKFWKLIVVFVVAVGAALKRFIAKLLGGKSEAALPGSSPQG